MKCEVGYNIYLPPDYARDETKRFPVIYFLHGRGGNESSNLKAFELLDGAIKAGKVPKRLAAANVPAVPPKEAAVK